MHKLAQSVAAYIRKHDLLRPGDRVGIAVSGGADSIALLRLMLELRDELGIVLSVVHLNHKLRGADSDADEQSVCGLAGAYGLEIIAESRDVKAFSADKKLSLEAAAREARYEFFARVLRRQVDRL
ncbi:MAG TPA: ATP-binding protein, partial [Terriglobales bacterium]|nr:ATP-binding protein [Terriglobales bacterium]